MCGLHGSLNLTSNFNVSRGLDLMAHRGPDGRGMVHHGDAIHGHVRLSLLDLTDAGAQPWQNGGCLSFVGEIWNHQELRTKLEAQGYTFKSRTDTEVLANALLAWGPEETLPQLDGMFSFAWSDDVGGHWLARDRHGKVPLHVLRKGDTWEWASERKAFGKRGGEPKDMFAGGLLDMRKGLTSLWTKVPGRVDEKPDDLQKTVLDHLRAGVRKRMVADAPLCCLVSGGLDSTIILMLALEVRKDVECYHAYLDPQSEDLAAARKLCKELGVRLNEVRVPQPTWEDVARAVWSIETVSKVQVELAMMCLPLAQRMHDDGFKACLSGEAADELFGGYGNSILKAGGLDDLGWRVHRSKLIRNMTFGNFNRCNKAFMSAGVECRLPFMERGLVDLTLSLGKQDCPPDKTLLKDACAKLVPGWVWRRTKETFQGGAGMSKAVEASVGCHLDRTCRDISEALWGRAVFDGGKARPIQNC